MRNYYFMSVLAWKSQLLYTFIAQVRIISFRITVDFERFNVLYSAMTIPVLLAVLRHVVMQNFGGEFLLLMENL